MPTMTITRWGAPASRWKAVLRTDDGLELVLPWAPRENTVDGLAARWSVTDRPGRSSLVLRDGEGTKTTSLTLLLSHLDQITSIQPWLDTLEAMASGSGRLTVDGMSKQERGPWRITGHSVAITQRKDTNVPTRATATLDLIAAGTAGRKGPLSGGATGSGLAKAVRHKVKKGQTCRSLAAFYYGDPGEWKRIAKRNKIKNPDKLKVGSTIVIPAWKG